MRFISLGTIDIKILIPVLGGIITLIFTSFIGYSPKIEIIELNPFLLCIYSTLGMILAFIPFLIIKYKSKRENKINNKLLIESKLYKKLIVSKNVFRKTRFKKFRFILYSTFLDFFQTLLATIFIPSYLYNLWIFDIILMSLFSFLILKTKFYKHQFISMIVIVVLGLGLNILGYFTFDNTGAELKSFDIFIQFIIEIFFCIMIVIMKYNMEKNYCNPYELCLWEGVFGFILYSICLTIFCKFELSVYGIKHPDNLVQYLNEFDYNDLIVCLTNIIYYFIYNLSLILTCGYFTPIHILIISIINETDGFFRAGANLALDILGFFILILIAIMLLVFIEVIEINICNLSYNIKKNIELRSKNDSLFELDSIYLLNNEPELDEESEKQNIPMDSINNN